MIDTIRVQFGLILTCSSDSSALSENQVNVPISAMSDALYSLGARLCRVSFFGMKWKIPRAEPMLDRFIQRYRVEMGSSVPVQKNLFDYGVQIPTDDWYSSSLVMYNTELGDLQRVLCTRYAMRRTMDL